MFIKMIIINQLERLKQCSYHQIKDITYYITIIKFKVIFFRPQTTEIDS